MLFCFGLNNVFSTHMWRTKSKKLECLLTQIECWIYFACAWNFCLFDSARKCVFVCRWAVLYFSHTLFLSLCGFYFPKFGKLWWRKKKSTNKNNDDDEDDKTHNDNCNRTTEIDETIIFNEFNVGRDHNIAPIIRYHIVFLATLRCIPWVGRSTALWTSNEFRMSKFPFFDEIESWSQKKIAFVFQVLFD